VHVYSELLRIPDFTIASRASCEEIIIEQRKCHCHGIDPCQAFQTAFSSLGADKAHSLIGPFKSI
jgi:hypothetical protein